MSCHRHLLLLAGVSLALAGCASSDLDSLLDGARSWTATARFAVERRGAGAINRAVTRQLYDRAASAERQAEGQLARVVRTDSERVIARTVLDSMARAVTLLGDAAR